MIDFNELIVFFDRINCKIIESLLHYLAIMTPKTPDNSADLFRSQLSQMLNMSHPLVRLSEQIDWDALAAEIEVVYSDCVGQPPLSTRLLVGLHYLKYTFNENNEYA